jgi:hypothetical protein
MAELIFRVLKQLWEVLERLQLPAAVMGGIAVSLWKHVRATQDVDLLIGVEPGREADLLDALRAAGFRPKRDPPVMLLGELRLLQLLYEPIGAHIDVQVDLLLADSEYHLGALDRRIPAPLPAAGVTVSVLTCEDLVLHKLYAGRLLDLADVGALLRANRSTLDVAYLAEWAERLNLSDDLNRIWNEALPDQPLPEP